MTKMVRELDLSNYAPVAARIELFYSKYPNGRITTQLVSREKGEITFKASVFRDLTDRVPSATGWASELRGDGDINVVACLENTETSAIGRALANLGFTASRYRPSYEEMQKVVSEQERSEGKDRWPRELRKYPAAIGTRNASSPQSQADYQKELIADLSELIDRAESAGAARQTIERARHEIASSDATLEDLQRTEMIVRDAVSQTSDAMP